MIKSHCLFWFLILAVVLSSCAIELEQPTVEIQAPPIEPLPPLPTPDESIPETNIVTSTKIPVTWSDLNLTGRLMYINGISVDNVFKL
jgi:hypothetical protein